MKSGAQESQRERRGGQRCRGHREGGQVPAGPGTGIVGRDSQAWFQVSGGGADLGWGGSGLEGEETKDMAAVLLSQGPGEG